ncbi:MAG: glucose-1-phosphate adenylyltransferase [Clostridia bacterium]|nr:glucose-1-phosphate adenylyltransferase [Clostridia bacterium]MBQ9997814.1 glucose-1-phosphate adenylyltransferase [Clostridia bacterium]
MNYRSKDCIAMLLAGGQGSRLMVLTEENAKPAVAFGGKYRIIDFPLANCVNSGIDTVGILTQYQPFELNNYIGNGQPWGLNRNFGGAFILPPYQRSKKTEWYKGTANAIYQNISFVDKYNPENVLILSGDHIYKMDYKKMIKYHKEKDADCTIAVLDVPLSEASRFGIMNTDKKNKIVEFEEKPKVPKSTNASMGVYVFKWQVLRDYLINDEEDPESSNDFGKNIIPKMLGDGKSMYAYNFDGYWKDVGTIESLWEANMDLLDKDGELKIKDSDFRIYARNYAMNSSTITKNAKIENSYITEGCTIEGQVKNSIISTGCTVGKNAVINKSVIMPGAVIKDGANIQYAIIGERTVVGKNAVIGENLDMKQNIRITVVGNDREVLDDTVVPTGEIK